MDYLNNLRIWAEQERIDEETLRTNICWFCDQQTAEKDFAETVYLNKDHQTTIGLTSRRHQWKELHRKLPRCKICYETHVNASSLAKIYGWLTALGCLLTGTLLPLSLIYLIWGTFSFSVQTEDALKSLGMIWAGIVITATACLGTFAYRYGKRRGLAASPKTRPIEYQENHPEISSLLMNGWKIGKIDYGQK